VDGFPGRLQSIKGSWEPLMFFINEERTMTNFSNASVRRMANKIMNLEEGKIRNILSGLEPEFRQQVVINIIQKRIEKGRNNA
jgi:hypothetical protein